mmetsp:Transcript_42345/g.83166  ORF Transcript_42345/g.83166 Transcript_42345/m.83166 type:complete len:213 (+) Transcript_42345:165-803(+)
MESCYVRHTFKYCVLWRNIKLLLEDLRATLSRSFNKFYLYIHLNGTHPVCTTPAAISLLILAAIAGSESACCASRGLSLKSCNVCRITGSDSIACISGSAIPCAALSFRSSSVMFCDASMMEALHFRSPSLQAALLGSIPRPVLKLSRALWFSFMSISISPLLAKALVYFGSSSIALSTSRLAPLKSIILHRAAERLFRIAAFFGERLTASS